MIIGRPEMSIFKQKRVKFFSHVGIVCTMELNDLYFISHLLHLFHQPFSASIRSPEISPHIQSANTPLVLCCTDLRQSRRTLCISVYCTLSVHSQTFFAKYYRIPLVLENYGSRGQTPMIPCKYPITHLLTISKLF